MQVDPHRFRKMRQAALVLMAKGRGRLGQRMASQSKQLDDGHHVATEKVDATAKTETDRQRDVRDQTHPFVFTAPNALYRVHDEAQEHVTEPGREPALIDRRERRHHAFRRAERVVLVAVLDIGNAFDPVEPR